MAHRFTPPLVADENGLPKYSRGPHLIALTDTHTSLRLYQWQRDLLCRVLEVYPPGHERAGQLRYRQVIISIPRQTGKSVIASVLALFGLVQHTAAPKVLGVARNAKQAGLVYGYTSGHISGSDALRGILKARGTSSLGISRIDGPGSYVVLAGDSDSLQGYPSTLAVVDELHIVAPEVYDAIVTSQRAQVQPLLVGITTAGDVKSALLKRLYAEGEKAIAGERESFGFFVWEASSDELSVETITEANPSVQEGHLSAQSIYDEDVSSPPANWRRYTLNRFVEGLAEPWVPTESWRACAGTGLEDFRDCIYAVDVTSTWSYATITASKNIDGVVHTSLIARLVKPNVDSLKAWADRLRKAGKCRFVMDPARLRTLVEYLDGKGNEPLRIYGGRKAEAAGLVYASVMQGKVNHDNAGLVNRQHSLAKTKSAGTEFIIVPNKADADACYASVYGIYAALTMKKKELQIA